MNMSRLKNTHCNSIMKLTFFLLLFVFLTGCNSASVGGFAQGLSDGMNRKKSTRSTSYSSSGPISSELAGLTGRLSGNTVYFSDGSTSRLSGRTSYNSDGTTIRWSKNRRTAVSSDGYITRFSKDGKSSVTTKGGVSTYCKWSERLERAVCN